jgi:hypothetical protein
MKRKLMAEVHDLKQIVPDGATGFAVAEVMFELDLLAQFERPVDILRDQFFTIPAGHLN